MQQLLSQIKYNPQGLIPAIAICADSGQVLMMAWMNEQALSETIRTKQVCYWSRSRQTLWRKGETSKHHQKLQNLWLDCDGDTLLISVQQTGAACHTGKKSCFFRKYNSNNDTLNEDN